MNILFLLYLAHFLGDYPLQTNFVYALKHKGYFGTFLHIFILFLVHVVLLLPYLSYVFVWYAIFLILILHFLQDTLKTKVGFGKNIFFGYLLDQFLHLVFSTVAFSVFILPNLHILNKIQVSVYSDLTIIIYLLGLVGVTFFADVTAFVLENGDSYSLKRSKFERDWKFMAKSAILFSISYFVFVLIWFYAK